MLISVVFSFRNEELVLPELLRRLEQSFQGLPGYQREYIFVNDDSTDRSLEILIEKRSEGYPIKIVNTSRRFGPEECVVAGMKYASGDAVITLDSDLQDPPELIPELIAHWRAGADVVYTVRTRRCGENRLKLAMTWLGYRAIRSLAEIDIPVDAGLYKLMSRRVVDEFLKLNETEPFVRALVRWVGFKQVSLPYELR